MALAVGVAFGVDIRYCARLLERFGLMRAPVIRDGQILGIVSFHDLVLRGLMDMVIKPG